MREHFKTSKSGKCFKLFCLDSFLKCKAYTCCLDILLIIISMLEFCAIFSVMSIDQGSDKENS